MNLDQITRLNRAFSLFAEQNQHLLADALGGDVDHHILSTMSYEDEEGNQYKTIQIRLSRMLDPTVSKVVVDEDARKRLDNLFYSPCSSPQIDSPEPN